jgi:two-component system, cell cycle response regulator DivK
MNSKYNWSGKTILIVEDDDPSFIYVSEIIKAYNPHTDWCKSGLTAFFHCMNYPAPDLVIMDIKLPEMSGYDSTRLIKKYHPGIPIIALTACAMQEEKKRCFLAGCDSYLTKPVFPNELLNAIDIYLSQTKSNSSNLAPSFR